MKLKRYIYFNEYIRSHWVLSVNYMNYINTELKRKSLMVIAKIKLRIFFCCWFYLSTKNREHNPVKYRFKKNVVLKGSTFIKWVVDLTWVADKRICWLEKRSLDAHLLGLLSNSGQSRLSEKSKSKTYSPPIFKPLGKKKTTKQTKNKTTSSSPC